MNVEKVDVFMPLYVGDYLADTTDLTPEEHGVYLLLLMNLWKRGGSLPCEPQRLARMVGLTVTDWERVWAAIGRFFEFEGPSISQGRLRHELTKAKALKAAASENGRKGAEVRWGSHSPANGVANGQPNGVATIPPMAKPMAKNSSSPSPSESPSESESPSPSPGDTRASARPRPRSLKPVAAPSQEPQPNQYTTVLEGFCALWQERYGEPYVPTPGDKSQLGRLMQGLPRELLADVPGCFRNYLRDEEPFVAQKMRHSLVHFCTQGGMNKYRVTTPVLSEKEARGVAASRQWLEHHGEKTHAGT